MTMESAEVFTLLRQTNFFNQQWKNHQDVSGALEFAELMRVSKNRCQLQLLKFADPTVVWAKIDHDQSKEVGELIWLVGGVGQPEGLACHIPLRILQEQLSSDQLAIWQVGEF